MVCRTASKPTMLAEMGKARDPRRVAEGSHVYADGCRGLIGGCVVDDYASDAIGQRNQAVLAVVLPRLTDDRPLVPTYRVFRLSIHRCTARWRGGRSEGLGSLVRLTPFVRQSVLRWRWDGGGDWREWSTAQDDAWHETVMKHGRGLGFGAVAEGGEEGKCREYARHPGISDTSMHNMQMTEM